MVHIQNWLCRGEHRRASTKLHRFLLNAENGEIVDHINGDKLDNRKSNLRRCTAKENARNCGIASNNSAGHTGIRRMPSGRWAARIMVDRKEIRVGTFDSFDDAVKAREDAEKLFFGSFAPCVRKEYCRDDEREGVYVRLEEVNNG